MGLFSIDTVGRVSQLSFILGGRAPHASPDLVIPQAFASAGNLVRAGDLNNDGFDDVVVANSDVNYGVVRGGATLSAQGMVTRASPDSVSAIGGVDLDQNGKPEFIVNQMSGGAKVFEGAVLDPAASVIPTGTCALVAWNDYDGDGYDDLVAECGTELKLCMGDGTLNPLCKYVMVGKVVR